MIVINNTPFSKEEIDAEADRLFRSECLRAIEGKIVAICSQQPNVIIGVVFKLMAGHGSLLLLPADTPLQTALNQAEAAGCAVLIHGDNSELFSIEGHERAVPGSLLQFSSGTTGAPKLIRRSWSEVRTEIKNYNLALASANEGTTTETPIIFIPLSHSFGLIAGALTAIERGVQPVIVTEKNPKYWVSKIRSIPESLVYCVPYMIKLMRSMSRGSLRFHKVITSGSMLPDDLFRELAASSTCCMQQYGSTETGAISIALHCDGPTNVGKPLRHITLEAANHSAEPGEIVVRLEGKDEGVHTRDLGYLNENGDLQLLGRMDDLINVSGLKVIPVEVESVILAHPKVREVVVFRGRHPVWGEAVRAMVIADTDTDMDGAVSAEEIKTWCMGQLPSYKVPGMVEFVQEIPRNAGGKINRKMLQEMES
ncbi:AMP-binding protein [Paenibacillus oenotherae]|uniref:AMP-binding protein n=1 Tax=Paenibacillus oenotherae TaxID=1435645 RepID=A0ABS7DBG3_9BACL|nr:AMP-binding protein [Paenibacillus oenotherae]MBW7476498.1 AMP-binding protein [Paenibacillus oenotherae]